MIAARPGHDLPGPRSEAPRAGHPIAVCFVAAGARVGCDRLRAARPVRGGPPALVAIRPQDARPASTPEVARYHARGDTRLHRRPDLAAGGAGSAGDPPAVSLFAVRGEVRLSAGPSGARAGRNRAAGRPLRSDREARPRRALPPPIRSACAPPATDRAPQPLRPGG